MEPVSSAPLERTTSQLSTASTRSIRGQTVRAKSKSRRLTSQPSSSASSIAASASDKSLTSFPSLSPESPGDEPPCTPDSYSGTVGTGAVKTSSPPTATSMVDHLTSSESQQPSRNALFGDTPFSTRKIPGALHLAEDECIERLVAKHGAVHLVRQLAEDVAHRDLHVAELRRRADERERALKKIVRECGLSNLDMETRLRTIEGEMRTQDETKRGLDTGLSDMMLDAMSNSVPPDDFGFGTTDATIRAANFSLPTENDNAKGTMKGWKDYFFGTGTGRKSSAASSATSVPNKAAVRGAAPGERRPTLQEDLFSPPETDSLPSSSRVPNTYSNQASQKPSTSLASMALQLVAGRANAGRDGDALRGRSSSAGQAGSLRTSSAASAKTSASGNVASNQAGPKALMAMRRTPTGPTNTAPRGQPRERRDTMGVTPPDPMVVRPDNYGPVEMDTIFSLEGQPPSLNRIYNNYQGAEYLTDRFGFIYDQRRKKRQREAAQIARHIDKQNGRAEMLSGTPSDIAPALIEGDSSVTPQTSSDYRPDTPSSAEEFGEQGGPKRWQDYLKIATFPTELLSHTPLISASSLEVLDGIDGPRSTGLLASERRGFVPSASTTAALNSENTSKPDEETPAATLVKEDVEPVKLLLQQLSDVHDALQREKTVRWNEFLRKVRAERKREGEAAAAAAVAAAQARFQEAPVMIPEAKLADGEFIGIADLGVKGKVGRAKWNEFRMLVLGGIPVVNRPKIWFECSGAIFKRVPGCYEDLVLRSGDLDDPSVVSQIDMDINRTLTDNIFFRKGPGVAKLKEILRAYARRNPEVGYCQGMNLITANLLLIMPSAEDTFWILVSIIEHILPRGYYDHSLMASRADQHVLRQYVATVLPKLSQHLEGLSIELEALTFQWFLSVFTDCLSAEALFRVWDVVLCTNDGSTFLFQVALALLKLNEQQLLQCDTPAAIYTYISQQMTNHAISIDGLIQASDGLRKVVRRGEVEERRAKAIAAEERQLREREERNKLRKIQKAVSATALATDESASTTPNVPRSPALGSVQEEQPSSGAATSEEEQGRVLLSRTPIPTEEEAQFGLG